MGYIIANEPPFSMTPWGLSSHPLVEKSIADKDVTIKPGTSLDEYLEIIYKNPSSIYHTQTALNMLNRDVEFKEYKFGADDPFVIRDMASVTHFLSRSKEFTIELSASIEKLGYKSSVDAGRKVKLFDTTAHGNLLVSGDKSTVSSFVRDRSQLSPLISNLDIAKKLSLCRYVNPGWFTPSYAGHKGNPQSVAIGLRVLSAHLANCIASKDFHKILDNTVKDVGHPLDTNVGSWLFSSQMGPSGEPISKGIIVETIKGLGRSKSYSQYEAELGQRIPVPLFQRFPSAQAPTRRLQAGFKAMPQWELNSNGLRSVGSIKGVNTVRVAWMSPYHQNLVISPLSSLMKAVRKTIPGCYHDGPTRTAYLHSLNSVDPFMLESDYKNYDRTIPISVVNEIFSLFCSYMPNRGLIQEAALRGFINVPIIYPNPVLNARNRGTIFVAPLIGLPSGLQYTSEIGSFVNLVTVLTAAVGTGDYTETQLISHLKDSISSVDARGNVKKMPSMIQSDDTLLLSTDINKLIRMGKSFLATSSALGMQGEITAGDRFLMRHMQKGCDRPVATRVLQNTISDEDFVKDPLIFMVGLSARTDGMMGFKSVDPFLTNSFNSADQETYNDLDRKVIEIISDQISNYALTPIPQSIQLLGAVMNGKRQESTNIRKEFSILLARDELKRLAKAKALSSFTSSILHNQYSLTATLQRSFMESEGGSEFESLVNQTTQREQAWYQSAMKVLDLNPHPLSP